MVRKIKYIITFAVICAILGASLPVYASTHSVYENSSISTTYITYFKDIISSIGFNDDYVAFRSGQNEYTLIVGDLDFKDNQITLKGQAKEYYFYPVSSSSFSSYQRYSVNIITNFSLDVGDYIIYSNVGDFPRLIERGEYFETLTTYILCVFGVCAIIRRIFFKR